MDIATMFRLLPLWSGVMEAGSCSETLIYLSTEQNLATSQQNVIS
jgi:hypothetical protein